jgi:hypothetical protein
MRIPTLSTDSGFFTHNSNRLPTRPTTHTAAKPRSATFATLADRALRLISVITIVALLDVTVILYVYPITSQLAFWAGFSWLKTLYIGMVAMKASIPFVLGATALIWYGVAKSRRKDGGPSVR